MKHFTVKCSPVPEAAVFDVRKFYDRWLPLLQAEHHAMAVLGRCGGPHEEDAPPWARLARGGTILRTEELAWAETLAGDINAFQSPEFRAEVVMVPEPLPAWWARNDAERRRTIGRVS